MPKIRNKTTGEIMEVGINELPSYGIAAPNQPITQPQQPTQGGSMVKNASNFLEGAGLGFIPGGLATMYEVPGMLRGEKKTWEERSKTNPFLTDNKLKSIQEFKSGEDKLEPVKNLARESAGAASWALPTVKGASIPAQMAMGAASAGLSEASQKDATLQSVGTSALTGSLFSGILGGGAKVVKKLGGAAKKQVAELFSPSLGDLDDLRRYGKMEFTDEVVKRDLPLISKMKPEKMLSYFKDMSKAYSDTVDDFLMESGATAKNVDVVKILNKAHEGRQNRVLQGNAIATLKGLADDFAKIHLGADDMGNLDPDLARGDIDLVTLNQLKRDVQDAARSFYTSNGESTAASGLLADVAKEINDLIESKAPGTKDINRSVMYYHMASDALQKKMDSLSKSGGFLKKITGQSLVPGLVGGALGMATGNPQNAVAYGILGSLGSAAVGTAYENPGIKAKIAQGASSASKKKMPEALRKILNITAGRTAGSLFDDNGQ